MERERRRRGKENVMKCFLRNLFRSLTGSAAVRPAARQTARTRLQVEHLEQRAVPTAVNLINTSLALAPVAGGNTMATLTVYTENLATGKFSGNLHEVVDGQTYNISVSGVVGQAPAPNPKSNEEALTFQGSQGLQGVSFTGDVTVPDQMHAGTLAAGYLDQVFTSYERVGRFIVPVHTAIDTYVDGWVQETPT